MATIQSLLQPSNMMGIILPQMVLLRSAYEGGMIFKQTVLHKRTSESAELFKDKIDNIAAQPVCKAIVDEMIDIIFESEPKREIVFLNAVNQPIDTPEWFKDFLDDADLEGNTMSDIMEKAATLASIEGWSWIFADLPEDPKRTNRPYLNAVAAENVIDWEYDTEGDGAVLSKLRVIEFQDAEKIILTQWTKGEQAIDPETNQMYEIPTTAERYRIDLLSKTNRNNEIAPIETYTFPVDYPIPAIQVVPVPDLRNRFIGNSDITEAADVQRQLLRLEAEAFDSIRFSKPLIRAAAGVKIPAGGGGIARGDKDSVEVIAIPTADIAEIRSQQQGIVATLDAYLGRSGVRKMTTEAQSGISIIEERRGLHRKAASRSRIMQSTEEQVFDLVAYMMGMQWVGEVEYNTDFEAKDTQYRLALLQTAKNLSANATVQEIIDLEVIKLIAPPDEVLAYLQKLAVATKTINTATIPAETSTEEVPGTEIETESKE